MKIKKYVEKKYDNFLLTSGIIGFALLLIFAWHAIGEYITMFDDGRGYSDSREAWGQFGDFLGGVLNPAIGALTVYLLLVSVYIQRKELRSSIAEMKESNQSLVQQDFRQTFFTWLESYREIVGGNDGRNYLKKNLDSYAGTKSFLPIFDKKIPPKDREYYLDEFILHGIAPESIASELKEKMLANWESLYEGQAHHIGAMFRTLYRLIRWVDEQDDNTLTPDQKYHYISIARAQLSDVELEYLFFNGLTRRGSSFVELINKYSLFNNLVFKGKPHLQLMQDPHNGPYVTTAYDSELAKKCLGVGVRENS